MARKEIVYLTGRQILIAMILIGNAMVIGFFMRWHAYKAFRLEDADLSTFTAAQRKEHDVKEDIRKEEGVAAWNLTAFAQKNPWSVLPEEKQKDADIQDLLK